MATGDVIKLGSIYLDNTIRSIPAYYQGENIRVGDTPLDDANKMTWVEVNAYGKKLLVANQNVLVAPSWKDLDQQGYIKGKTVTIDGQQYLIRAMTGGNNTLIPFDYAGGGTLPNEWDDIICNRLNLNGLPTPVSSDLDIMLNNSNSVHNKIWNWFGRGSWCQEPLGNSTNVYVIRGNQSVRYHSSSVEDTRAGSIGYRPVLEVLNTSPTVTISSPTPNQTLYENSSLTMAGNTTDTDIDNVVTVKYQINSGTVRNLHSAVSDGATAINFSKALTYKDGVLFDGATAVTSVLDKDMPHTVSIWAEDDKGGKSTVITRSFFVVPNRPPTLTINPIAAQSELINSNVINVDGAVSDLDGNDVTVTFSINGGEEQQVYQGPPAAFAFNLLLNDLRVGTNTVLVKATDTYNFQTTKTLTITKTHDAVPVNEAVALYKITAPTGSAKSILLWITRTLGAMNITAEISLTDEGEAENFVALTKTNSAVINGLRQDEFAYQGDVEKTNIVLKITYDRTDAASVDVIKQISGVLF